MKVDDVCLVGRCLAVYSFQSFIETIVRVEYTNDCFSQQNAAVQRRPSERDVTRK